MKINAYVFNSFAKTKVGGNLAGVVLGAEVLSVEEMRGIAAALGFSETAFVLPSTVADYKLRFFTPKEEVDLCGHATVAAFSAMSSLGILKPGKYEQETRAGRLGIDIHQDNFVMMDQPLPIFSETIDKGEIADSLDIYASHMVPDMFPQVVSTGLRDIIVPVRSKEVLDRLKPDMDKIKAISCKYHAVGYHVFALGSEHGADACCRNFAPLYGILEESATGTSSGALGCYLYHYGKVKQEKASHLVFAQGYIMEKPSEIHVKLVIKDNGISEVKVGGQAMGLRSVEVEI